jgi:hypothetical protein
VSEEPKRLSLVMRFRERQVDPMSFDLNAEGLSVPLAERKR